MGLKLKDPPFSLFTPPMKPHKTYKLKTTPSVYYVWVAGSCDYGHTERCSGGAYVIQKDEEIIDTYTTSDIHATEFRMILTAMIHAMEVIPENANIVFLTNVAYIQQNFDREPTAKSANPDLINACRQAKSKHLSVEVKLIPFHKYHLLVETHERAHQAMVERQRHT